MLHSRILRLNFWCNLECRCLKNNRKTTIICYLFEILKANMETKHTVLIDTNGMIEEKSIKYILENAIHLNFGKIELSPLIKIRRKLKNSLKKRFSIQNLWRTQKKFKD